MVGTITFGGIGSGMDTESIVSGLVSVERAGQKALQSRLNATQSSISNLSSVSSLLAKLKSAAEALDTSAEVGSYKATSSGNAIVASASGLATPGKYTFTVEKLAQEQRTYSNTFASATEALGQAGTLSIQVGSGTATDIAISADDKLDDVIGKINSAGLKVTASAFFDGTTYRIQLRGQESGAANALTISENGTSFGFNDAGNTTQIAQDARIKLDNQFTITSSTNQVTGAIRGVTLALTAESASPITVSVENDPAALKTKLTALVDAYNAVVGKVKEVAGNGGTKATDALLAGDSTLRSITSRISSALQKDVGGSSAYRTLGSIGLAVDRTGRLSLDASKLDKALAADAEGVSRLLSGTDANPTGGVMDVLSSTIDAFTAKDKGLLTSRSEAFTARVKALQDRIDREEARINRYGDQLRKQFTAMDTMVASWHQQSSYLAAYL